MPPVPLESLDPKPSPDPEAEPLPDAIPSPCPSPFPSAVEYLATRAALDSPMLKRARNPRATSLLRAILSTVERMLI